LYGHSFLAFCTIMTKRKRNKRRGQKRGVAHPPNKTSGPSIDVRQRRSREIRRDLLKGLLLAALLLAIKTLVEQTSFGQLLEFRTYNLIQEQLLADRVPVSIVDISDLKVGVSIKGRQFPVTPRRELLKIITAIASQRPKAIGIDIDFSPAESGYLTPDDQEFFQACLRLENQTQVPIFLGVARSVTKSSTEWLGDERFQALAANIVKPVDPRRMLTFIRIEEEPSPGGRSQGPRLSKAMSVALADAYGRNPLDEGGWLSGMHRSVLEESNKLDLLERMSEKSLGPGLTMEDFLVDFSPLKSIEPIQTTNPVVLMDTSQHKHLEGKVVLVGEATLGKTNDVFLVPGYAEPYPGVFLHCCAAYTLIKAPLYGLTWKGRLSIDIVFSISILLCVTLVRLYYKNKSSEEVAVHRLQGFLTIVVVIAAIIVGVVSVRFTRVMWDDFFLALCGLALHPLIENRPSNIWKQMQIREYVANGFDWVVFGPKDGSDRRAPRNRRS
jgi:CHASE2 domain-containing sensor protein